MLLVTAVYLMLQGHHHDKEVLTHSLVHVYAVVWVDVRHCLYYLITVAYCYAPLLLLIVLQPRSAYEIEIVI